MGVAGAGLTAPMVAVSPTALFLTCMFLAWPALTWRHIGRAGTIVTIRRVFGRRRLEADRCMIGYRIEGGSRRVEFKVYITDGVNTVDLAEHLPSGSGGTERDVARLTALLLDPGAGSTGKVRSNSAARRKVEADRNQVEAGREYVRSYHGGKDWWASRRFWLPLVLMAGGALLYSTVAFVLFEVLQK